MASTSKEIPSDSLEFLGKFLGKQKGMLGNKEKCQEAWVQCRSSPAMMPWTTRPLLEDLSKPHSTEASRGLEASKSLRP